MHIYDLISGDTAKVLRKDLTELPEEFDFFDAITNGGSPTRDISWHPHLPLIASTSFRGHIDLYTLQNFDQTELE